MYTTTCQYTDIAIKMYMYHIIKIYKFIQFLTINTKNT